MPVDTNRGFYEYFEDFLVTAIGDLPEVDVVSATGVTTAILANQVGGVVEVPVGSSNDDDVAAVSTNLNWHAGANGQLIGSVRMKVDTSVADMKWFIGFGDSIASADETSFSATSDTVTIDTMTDGVGFLFDGDATTLTVWAVAGKTDAVTVGEALPIRFVPALGVYHTFTVKIGRGATMIEWYIDDEEVHRVDRRQGDTTSYISTTAPLALGLWAYEQGTACEYEVDYIWASKARHTGDSA